MLILFVIAVALAPLSHFLPSKRQRQISRLREYAAVHGLFVEFRSLPGAGRAGGAARSAPGGDIIYYGKRLSSRRKDGFRGGSWLHDDQGWRGLDRSYPAPAPLLDLSTGMLAASVDEGSCGIYWQETGGEEDIDRIRQVLEAWCKDLCA